MNRRDIYSYLYDFIRFLMAHAEPVEIILFGSVARGDFDENSDIDLFINVKDKHKQKEMEKIVKQSQKEFETAALYSWSLKGVGFPVKVIVGDLDSPRWSALRREIISTGKVIFGKYRELPQNLNQHYLLSFDLKTLQPKEKVSFIRQLYGYQSKRGSKIYHHIGILQGKGVKVNQNTLLIPANQYNHFSVLLKQFRIKTQIREVWM